MNQMVTVGGASLAVKEYKGQRVVTFNDIDIVHSRRPGTSGRNFRQNRKHFAEGTDYFKIQRDEIRTVGIKSNNDVVILTESGYLMLVKSLTDDKAWEVQRKLVECYFHAKQEAPKAEQLRMAEPYEYRYKEWNGQQVVTLRDVAYLTGMSHNAVYNALRGKQERMRDGGGWLLNARELQQLWKQTKDFQLYGLHSTAWVLTERGCREVLGLDTCAGMTIWKKKAALTEGKMENPLARVKRVGIDYTNMEASAEAQACIQQIRKAIHGLDIMLSSYNLHHMAKQFPEVQGAISQLVNCIWMESERLKKVPIQTIVCT